MHKGYFLTIEGLGGSGKTTLRDKIADWFRLANIEFIMTREPGGTPAAENLRQICRTGSMNNSEPFTPMATALLFNAARAQHVELLIKPALEAGKVVICDRYLLSTLGLQGVGQNLSIYTLKEIHHHAIGLYPDKTILMEGCPEVFAKRLSSEEKATDQFDSWTIERNNRIQFFFEREAADNKDKYHLVDAEENEDQVFAQVLPLLIEIQNTVLKRPKPVPLPRHRFISSTELPRVDTSEIDKEIFHGRSNQST